MSSESADTTGPTVAAIDIGTNSTRLLIRRADQVLTREMQTTRLGAGVDRTGRLDPEAIERTLTCLREYRDLIDNHNVSSLRMTATSAARDAENRETFFAGVEASLGERPELLSGDDEGQLAFAGATGELDPEQGPFLVVDIGGGSTELAFGTTSASAVMSLDIGSVRLTEKYLEHDPPRPEELHACISVTEAWLDEVALAHPQIKTAKTCVGTAGTFSTAAAVEIGLAEYDRDAIHHFRLTRAAAEDVFRTLATEPVAQRGTNPGLPSDRADIIVGGMCILIKVMRFFDLDECLISESDILDGLAASLLSD